MAGHQPARSVMERIDVLARISEEPNRLTRRFATEALVRAGETVGGWMRGAGMTVRRDNIGNVIGRYEADNPHGARTLVAGSHLDTVRDAGRFDGTLGVLIGIAAVERLHARGQRLPFAVDVIGFADKEGVRFGEEYLGSKAVCGRFESAYLELVDEDGVRMADAIRAAGGTPEAVGDAARDGAELLGYCEVHIEQGPVLEATGLSVGVVSAIVGKSTIRVTFSAEDCHAGTAPMERVPDPVIAAAEFVLAVEASARGEPGLVATVVQFAIATGDPHATRRRATLSLDVRHHTDAVRKRASHVLERRAAEIASQEGVRLEWQLLRERPAVPCSPELSGLLAEAAEDLRNRVCVLPSGAGHDAGVMAGLAPVALLLVPCVGGVTHNPAESVEEEDIAVAIGVLGRFLELLAWAPG